MNNKKKRILIVNPTNYDAGGNLVKTHKAYAPMRTPFYLAALTPRQFECYVIDEIVEDLDFNSDVDLVALTGMLHHVPRMIEISREFLRRGRPVIAGGVGIYSLQEEVISQRHFTSVVLGEAENFWKDILEDFEAGHLKPCYRSSQPPQLEGMPFARYDLLKPSRYMKSFLDKRNPLLTVETSRGCPHACKFCLVSRYFGRKMRYRPVSEVADEIRHYGAKFIFFSDDNILVNPNRSRELFQALKPLKIRWQACFDCAAVNHPELLRLAAESGCVTGFIGVESLVKENFSTVNKVQNVNIEFGDVIKGFRNTGIIPIIFLMFGMDYDTRESIEWTFNQLIKNRVEILIPWIITPIPKTPLYEEYDRDGRLLHRDFSLYDSMHCVIQPKSISPQKLNDVVWKGLNKFYAPSNIFKRILLRRDIMRIWKLILPGLFANFYTHRLVKRHLHPGANVS